MAMRLALFVLFLLGSVGARAALEPPPPYFEDAAQDSAGNLWAFSRAEYNKIYRFDGTQWSEMAAPFDHAHRAMPAKVARMGDGSVDCVWRYDDHSLAVTRHLANESQLLGTCPGEIPGSGLQTTPLADAQNRLWITGDFAKIYRADPKEGVTMVHQITPEECNNPAGGRDGYNKIHAVEDGHGRVWVWSESEASNWASLRGVLVFTGDTAELRDPLPNRPGARILALVRADDRHMWLTVADDGLYQIDIDSFTLQRIPDPASGSLCCVHELFVHGTDVYAVEKSIRSENTLWRLREGQWKQVIVHLDVHPNASEPRSWLPIAEGLLVQSYGAGPWFIPPQGEPAQLSWRTGLVLEGAHSLNRLADGSFFALCFNGPIFHGPLSLPPRERETPRILKLDTNRDWTLDASGQPWIILENSSSDLNRWDGQKWVSYPIPGREKEAANYRFPRELVADAQGRVWVMGQANEDGVQVFDIKEQRWQSFPDLATAYVDLRDHPPHFLTSRVFQGIIQFDPQYTGNHRIAYRQGVTILWYYDGSVWQKIERHQITGKPESDPPLGPPWFDREGRLCVNFRDKTTWQRNDAGGWSQIPFQSHYPTDGWSEDRPAEKHLEPPDGCVTEHPESIMFDNRGTAWLTWQGALYKCITGHCVKVFGDDEVNPFRSRSIIHDAFTDEHGNALLLTSSAAYEAFVIKPKAPPPRTTITVDAVGTDSAKVRLHTDSTLAVEFHWRLDEGPPQSTSDDTLALNGLPNGVHKLTVSAISADLVSEESPALATFETKIDPDRQIAGLISKLSVADYAERKSAVDSLALQPALAVPALQQARRTANEDTRWWIDAALQNIQRQKQAAEKD